MKKILLQVAVLLAQISSAQNIDQIITVKEVTRIETTLASDDMMGRRTFTPGIEKAAAFIKQEMEQIGLQKFQNLQSFLQTFSVIRTKFLGVEAQLNGKIVESKNIVAVTIKPVLKINEQSGYKTAEITTGANLLQQASDVIEKKRKYSGLGRSKFRKRVFKAYGF